MAASDLAERQRRLARLRKLGLGRGAQGLAPAPQRPAPAAASPARGPGVSPGRASRDTVRPCVGARNAVSAAGAPRAGGLAAGGARHAGRADRSDLLLDLVPDGAVFHRHGDHRSWPRRGHVYLSDWRRLVRTGRGRRPGDAPIRRTAEAAAVVRRAAVLYAPSGRGAGAASPGGGSAARRERHRHRSTAAASTCR